MDEQEYESRWLLKWIRRGVLPMLDSIAERMPGPVPRVWRFMRDVDQRFHRTHSVLVAAGIAFYGIVCLTPLGIIAVAGLQYLLGTKEGAADALESAFDQVSPEGAAEIITQLESFFSLPNAALTGGLGAISLLWAGNRLFETLVRALNASWPDAPDPGFLRRKLAAFLTLFGAGAALVGFMVATSAAATLRQWATEAGLPDALGVVPGRVWGLVIGVPFALVGFWLIYKFLPNRKVSTKAAAAGAVAATVGLLIAQPIFTLFIGRSTQSQSLYGSLTSVVLFALWMYVVAQLVMWGSHVAAQVAGAPMPEGTVENDAG